MNITKPFQTCLLPGVLSAVLGAFLLALGLGAFATDDPTATANSAPTQSYARQLRQELAAEAAIIATVNAAPVRVLQRSESAALPYAAEVVAAGETSYASVCSACHGMDAQGMPNLGKTLADSEFMRGLSDTELLTFIKTGRPIWDAANTTGVDMPPKGGNPALTDDEILHIIAYLRTLDPLFVPPATDETSQAAAPESAAAPTLAPTLAPTNAPAVATQPAAANTAPDGASSYTAYCSACHGMDAQGMPNLGKDLVDSEFVHTQTDAELLTFIKTGRPIWDAANTTGVDMPPKGGNPALTDDEILAIIAYLRGLHQ